MDELLMEPAVERAIASALSSDSLWARYWEESLHGPLPERSLHLGVFVQPFLRYVLEGRKTIESRFSVNRLPPYGRVAAGDVLLLKAAGGPVLGICRISHSWSYQLKAGSREEIRRLYGRAMCAEDPEFWVAREGASFATLMRLADVRALPDTTFPKSDRRGWVILKRPRPQLELEWI